MRCPRHRALPEIACVLLASLGVFSSLAKGAAAADHAAAATLPAEVVQAIRDGNAERLPAFLTGGGDVNARDADGNTSLILAALYSKPDIVEFLIKKGADANAANRAGATALIRAATDPVKARLLLDAGAKAQVRTELGNTPLILAARRLGNSATVKLLLERGTDVSAKNTFGIGALHTAAASGDLDSVGNFKRPRTRFSWPSPGSRPHFIQTRRSVSATRPSAWRPKKSPRVTSPMYGFSILR